MEAPGIETDSGQPENTEEHQSGTISTDADPADVSDRAPKCAIVRGVVTESSEAYELLSAGTAIRGQTVKSAKRG